MNQSVLRYVECIVVIKKQLHTEKINVVSICFYLLTISAMFYRYTLARNDEDNVQTLVCSSQSPLRRRPFRSLSIPSKHH